jgi:hypothetical protein
VDHGRIALGPCYSGFNLRWGMPAFRFCDTATQMLELLLLVRFPRCSAHGKLSRSMKPVVFFRLRSALHAASQASVSFGSNGGKWNMDACSKGKKKAPAIVPRPQGL